MNIGQVLEVHLGYAAKALGWKIATPVFDGATEDDIIETLEKAGSMLQTERPFYMMEEREIHLITELQLDICIF